MKGKALFLPLVILVVLFFRSPMIHQTSAYFIDQKAIEGPISLKTGYLALEKIPEQRTFIKKLEKEMSYEVAIKNIGTLDGQIILGSLQIVDWPSALYGNYSDYLSLNVQLDEQKEKLVIQFKKKNDWNESVPIKIQVPIRLQQKNKQQATSGFYDEMIFELSIFNDAAVYVKEPLYFSAVNGKMTTLIPGEIHADSSLEFKKATLAFWAGSQIVKEIVGFSDGERLTIFPEIYINDVALPNDVLSSTKTVNLRAFKEENGQGEFLNTSLEHFIVPFVLSSEQTGTRSVSIQPTLSWKDLESGVLFHAFNNQLEDEDVFSFSDYAKSFFEEGKLQVQITYRLSGEASIYTQNVLNQTANGAKVQPGSIPRGATHATFEIRDTNGTVLLSKAIVGEQEGTLLGAQEIEEDKVLENPLTDFPDQME